MIRNAFALTAALGALLVAHEVRADDDTCDDTTTTEGNATLVEQPDIYSYSWREAGMPSGIGVGMILGGGITGFTNQTMRDSTSTVGGLWDARLSIGTHVPIGVDVTYLGTASTIDSLTGTGSGTLVGTTVEGALRWNILPHSPVDPYVFAGLGWQRYNLTNVNTAFAASNVAATSDNFLEVPMGAGLALRNMSGFTFDLRGTFRAAATQSTMIINPSTGQAVDMHTWEASAALGYEF